MNSTGSGLVALFRSERLKQNMTQKDVADQIGLSANAYGKIELGARGLSSDLIGPLCHILHVPPSKAMTVLMQDSDTEPDTGKKLDTEYEIFPDPPGTERLRQYIAEFLSISSDTQAATSATDYILYLRQRLDASRKQQTERTKKNGQTDNERPDDTRHDRKHPEKPQRYDGNTRAYAARRHDRA